MSSSTSTPQRRVIIVHDVLGTLFSLTEPIAVLKDLFADQLGPDAGVADKFAELIIMDWYHATQRDFTNLSMNGAYTSIATIFKNTLPRVLLQAGLVPPGTATSKLSTIRTQASTEGGNPFPLDGQVVTQFMQSLQRLKPRPGMVEAFSKTYRDTSLHPSGVASVELWGATNGGRSLATALFEGALGKGTVHDDQRNQDSNGGQRPSVSVWSCDDVKIAKPSPEVYAAVKKTIIEASANPDQDVSLWFVASHSWDTDAAFRAGFKTCWTTYEEFHPAAVDDVKGGGNVKPLLQANDLAEAARKIWQWESEHGAK